LIIFWVLGARAYALDVAIIESEIVETAIWVQKNTPEGSLIAAHDIGALGYFAQRDIIDLAGLISPEVIPFIRDEDQIGQFISQSGADYLITFPGVYPNLIVNTEIIYQGQSHYSPGQGGENMAVYKWTEPR
jgi:hypothetical protein